MFKELRRSDKQMSEVDTYQLLTDGQVGILGTYGSNQYPYTVAVNYVYFQDKIYFHCAKEGHKIDNIRYHDKVSFSVYDQVEVVGEELTTKYRSVTLFGRARVLDASEDVLLALIQKYTNFPTQQAVLLIQKELSITAMVEIEIDHLTGKIGNK